MGVNLFFVQYFCLQTGNRKIRAVTNDLLIKQILFSIELFKRLLKWKIFDRRMQILKVTMVTPLITRLIVMKMTPLKELFCNFPLFCNCPLAYF